MDKNFVKKELLKTKVLAYFKHFNLGKLYYSVVINDETYEFPVSTVKQVVDKNSSVTLQLAEDVCGAKFGLEIQASFLNRWIERAIESGDFVKLSE